VRRLLAEEFPGAGIEEAGDDVAALALTESEPFDLVLLDLSMPGRGGLELLKDIRARGLDVPVLVLTLRSEHQYAERALRAGASGYITKEAPVDELLVAVRKVIAGGRYLSLTVAERLAAGLAGVHANHEALSDREIEVVRRLAAGASVKEIALELHLSEKTISTYRSRSLSKLGLRTTAELVRYALEQQLL
jgi:two-component system, NarL family, invasion response regulator UvrY